jgi:ribosomal protein S18 acetylase RimI-like enzyme
MVETAIRAAKKEDIDRASELIFRMKRLNNEFDPLFTVVDDAPERAKAYLSRSLESKNIVVLVGTSGKKVVAVLRAEIRERLFYKPAMDGHITDFYILPEYRRRALGNRMLERASSTLRHMGAEMVTAEVPAQNEIAVRFYSKRGFRALNNIFAGKVTE